MQLNYWLAIRVWLVAGLCLALLSSIGTSGMRYLDEASQGSTRGADPVPTCNTDGTTATNPCSDKARQCKSKPKADCNSVCYGCTSPNSETVCGANSTFIYLCLGKTDSKGCGEWIGSNDLAIGQGSCDWDGSKCYCFNPQKSGVDCEQRKDEIDQKTECTAK